MNPWIVNFYADTLQNKTLYKAIQANMAVINKHQFYLERKEGLVGARNIIEQKRDSLLSWDIDDMMGANAGRHRLGNPGMLITKLLFQALTGDHNKSIINLCDALGPGGNLFGKIRSLVSNTNQYNLSDHNSHQNLPRIHYKRGCKTNNDNKMYYILRRVVDFAIKRCDMFIDIVVKKLTDLRLLIAERNKKEQEEKLRLAEVAREEELRLAEVAREEELRLAEVAREEELNAIRGEWEEDSNSK
jgi:hypothetical protein